ncbi:antA/AntB antirepressor family protein [Acidithiobacillus sp. MC6.1]|nr:antA/AntB antirepressor family protein [Acidithiobacillus sp. MC6.1]
MNELIVLEQQEINGEVEQTVNARELHTFLEVGKDFSNWIKDRINQSLRV